MRNLLVFAAAIAALAVVTSCSSDDIIADNSQESVTKPAGTPLVVKVVDGNTDATRALEWKATTLPKFTLYAIENNSTNRWEDLCSYSNTGVSHGTDFTNDGNGNFASSEAITWADGNWDFYALSDATFAKESDGNDGQQDAEHFAVASGRNFTYTVSNDYTKNNDLLVASTLNQSSANSTVNLNFVHALARIKSVKLNFKAPSEDNSSTLFIIKSMTLKNVHSTSKFTFPSEQLTKNNVNAAWSDLTDDLVDYTFTFPDFERDKNGKIKIFVETEEEGDNPDIYENIGTAYATTNRGGINGLPNFLSFGTSNAAYEFPLAKNGVQDSGLYVIPQTLAKTQLQIVNDGNAIYYHFNTDGTNNYTTPYLEVRFLALNDGDYSLADPTKLGVEFESISNAYGGDNTGTGNWTNARITDAIDNDDLCTVSIPLSSITLVANKYYTLNFYFNMAVNTDDDDTMIFEGADLE